MGKANFSDEFKRDAVVQITERGYRVAEVSERLGVTQHSLYAWKRQFAQRPEDRSKDAEIRQLKRELQRVTEERDILKKPPRISPGMQSEIRVRGRAATVASRPRLSTTRWPASSMSRHPTRHG